MTISEELGAFIAGVSLDHLPDEVIDKAKACLFWGLCGSFTTDNSYANNKVDRTMAAAVASACPAAPGASSTVLLGGVKASPSDAMFANAVLFDNTMCDSYMAASHFGPAVLPTTLAIAEHEDQSGAAVLAAIVAGYEVAAALTKNHLAPTMDNGWRGALIFGVFGAAAAATNLMHLDAQRAANAIGFSAGLSCGSMEPMYAHSMENKLIMGIAARNGYTSAFLGREGVRSAPPAFEGKAGFLVHYPATLEFKDQITRGLGKNFEIMNVTFKRFEASGRAHTPMLLALQLAEEEDLDPAEIESVELELNAFEERYPPRREHEDAHMVDSVAGALTYRSGRSDLIIKHDNPVYLHVLERISKGPAEDLGPYCARLTVTTKNARYYREIIDGPKSHSFTFDATIELAHTRQEMMNVSEQTLEKIAAIIRNFEERSDVGELIELAKQAG